MCCCAKGMAKFFLIVFNAIFFLLGGALIAVGVWVLLDSSTTMNIMARIPENDVFDSGTLDKVVSGTSYLSGAAIGLLVAGGLIFIIGFCGCCGAIRESKAMLGIYTFLVITIILLEVAAIVLGAIFFDKFIKFGTNYLEATIYYKYQGSSVNSDGTIVINNEVFTAAWDMTQMTFSCCGVWNSTDYSNTTAWNNTFTYNGNDYTMVVPPTCCKVLDKSKWPTDVANLQFTNLTECLTTANVEFTNIEGCYSDLKAFVKNYVYIIGGVAAAIALLEFIGVISACVLMCSVGKDKVNTI